MTLAPAAHPEPACFGGMLTPGWPGRSESGSVLVPLPAVIPCMPGEPLFLNGLAFHAKDELHLTVLSTREAEALAARLPEWAWREAFEAEVWEMKHSVRAVLLHEHKPTGDEYSLITPVDCPALNRFRTRLATDAGLELPATLPHVTLWIRPFGRGIGLSSLAQYESCRVRELDPDEAAPFLRGTGCDLPAAAATDNPLNTGDRNP